MKYAGARPYADPEKAARRIMEIANGIEAVQGMVHIEKINYPMLFKDGATPAEYWAGLQHAIAKGGLKYHESGTFVTFTKKGLLKGDMANGSFPIRHSLFAIRPLQSIFRASSGSMIGMPWRIG